MDRGRLVRIARALWVVWAVIVWNVVFDRVIVVAGRAYIRAAIESASAGGPRPRMDDFMRPAIPHGVWLSSASALAILAIGLPAIAYASRHERLQGDE
jgi:hypothetical protein